MPDDPTVYVCAQDRGDTALDGPERPERLLILVNAPAVGDLRTFDRTERERCTDQMLGRLKACGLTLTLDPGATTLTTPNEFATLFPGTGGAIYGRASHGWRASFLRPDSRTAIPGLFLAGGSVMPGVFWRDAFANPLTTAITLDVYLAAGAFTAWVAADRALGAWRWACIAA